MVSSVQTHNFEHVVSAFHLDIDQQQTLLFVGVPQPRCSHVFLSGLQTIHSFKMFSWQGFQIYLSSKIKKSPPSQHSIFDHLFFTTTSNWLPSIHHFNILPHLCQGQLCATQQIDELMLVTRFFSPSWSIAGRYGPRIQISPKFLIYLNPQMHYGGVIYIRSSHAIIKQFQELKPQSAYTGLLGIWCMFTLQLTQQQHLPVRLE